MRIGKILCPTDLSANSVTGIVYARALAQEHGARLVVLHVTSFPRPPLAAYGEIDSHPFDRRIHVPPSADRILLEAAAKLDSFIARLRIADCGTTVTLGDPVREILRSAVHEKVDLIIMAKRHRGFVRRIFSRSISEELSRKAPCPVLSICPPRVRRPLRVQHGTLQSTIAGAEV